MKIGLYIKDLLYVTGGTESYTVRMAQALIEIYPEAKIYFITELYKKSVMPKLNLFVNALNSKYGTKIFPNNVVLQPIRGSSKKRISSFLLRKKIENSSRGFDLFFYCSRGYYIFKAKKNVAIIHFPMQRLEKLKNQSGFAIRFLAKMKDKRYATSYDLFLPNSNFTNEFLREWWGDIDNDRIRLLYPPVMQIKDLKLNRKNQIFVCSRLERDKNLESLMDAFKSSVFLAENYKLVIAGGSDEGSVYLPELKAYASGYNIEILDNASFADIVRLYNESKFFWHCKGYGVAEFENPYKCEHFGITTVEAMSVGCIPIVINKAGQKEIVNDDCGEKWLSLDELVNKTVALAKNEILQKTFAENSKKRAENFLLEKFTESLKKILHDNGV